MHTEGDERAAAAAAAADLVVVMLERLAKLADGAAKR